ncbi:MAG TPA: hypothetical protein VGH33_05570, partial [Isosphaeraceae bacterium]
VHLGDLERRAPSVGRGRSPTPRRHAMNEAFIGFTVDGLKKLPIRAIVALAARCARRVEPLAQLP